MRGATRRTLALALGLGPLVAPAAAAACDPAARVVYRESAPTDFLSIENVSVNAEWRLISVEIDLTPSGGALIFDTVSGGPGTDSAQPLRWVGGAKPVETPAPRDGQRVVALSFEGVLSGDDATFSLDLDDVSPNGWAGSRVSGEEIAGARVAATFERAARAGAVVTLGAFREDGVALAEPPACG